MTWLTCFLLTAYLWYCCLLIITIEKDSSIIPFLSCRDNPINSIMSSSSTNIANLESIIDRVFFSYTLADNEVEPFISLLHKKLSIPTCCFDNINKVKRNPPRREIKGSGVSVVVFSERYGGSSRCLKELEKILECHRVQGQVVLPVFFGVDVCDVREQKGIFGQEFELMVKRRSVEEDTVLTWRKALSEIASFTGYSAPPDRFRYDPHLKYYIDSFDQY